MLRLFLYDYRHDAGPGCHGVPYACGKIALGGMDGQILRRNWHNLSARNLIALQLIYFIFTRINNSI